MQKTCSKCKNQKPFGDYHKAPKGRFGLSAKCKSCMKAYYIANREKLLAKSKANAENNKDRVKKYQGQYRENNKEKGKAYAEEYYKKNSETAKVRAKKWTEDNSERAKKTKREYHKKNAGKIRARTKKWAKDNPERASINARASSHRRRARIAANGNNTLTANEIRALFFKITACVYCGAKENLSLEHIIPISKGGQNCLSNVTVSCLPCNLSKGASLDWENKTTR